MLMLIIGFFSGIIFTISVLGIASSIYITRVSKALNDLQGRP